MKSGFCCREGRRGQRVSPDRMGDIGALIPAVCRAARSQQSDGPWPPIGQTEIGGAGRDIPLPATEAMVSSDWWTKAAQGQAVER